MSIRQGAREVSIIVARRPQSTVQHQHPQFLGWIPEAVETSRAEETGVLFLVFLGA